MILKTCSKYVIIVGGTKGHRTAARLTLTLILTFRVHTTRPLYVVRRSLTQTWVLKGIIALFALRVVRLCATRKITPTALTVTAFCLPINFQYFQRRSLISPRKDSPQFTSQGLNRMFEDVLLLMNARTFLSFLIVLLFLFKILKQDSKKEIHQKQISNDHQSDEKDAGNVD